MIYYVLSLHLHTQPSSYMSKQQENWPLVLSVGRESMAMRRIFVLTEWRGTGERGERIFSETLQLLLQASEPGWLSRYSDCVTYREIEVPLQGVTRDSTVLHRVHTACGIHAALYPAV
jgi:hypothetical protein